MADRGHYPHLHSNKSNTQTSPLYSHMGAWQQSPCPNNQGPLTFPSYDYPQQVPSPNHQPAQHDLRSDEHYYTTPRHWAYGNPEVNRVLNDATLNHLANNTRSPYSHYYYDAHTTSINQPQTNPPTSNRGTNSSLTTSNLHTHERQTAPSRSAARWAREHPSKEAWHAVGEVGKNSEYRRSSTKL